MNRRELYNEWEREMGLHSGFPRCCVDEFCMNSFVGRKHLLLVNLLKKQALGGGPMPGYIPCWSCIDRALAGRQILSTFHHRCTFSGRYCIELWNEHNSITGSEKILPLS